MNIAIIPARGKSKGIPKKNIKNICGYPLIFWSIQAAKNAKKIDKFYVSTEDSEIKSIANFYGAEVLDRPDILASDESKTIDVLTELNKKIKAKTIIVLQPTSPIRNQNLIDECIEEFYKGKYDSLATGYNCKIVEYGKHNNLRRQDIDGFFYDDGNIYILDGNLVNKGMWYGNKLCKKIISRDQNYEIDDITDFKIVECLLENRIQQGIQTCDIYNKLRNIKLLIMDVDGVLTDAGMYYSENGDEQKKFNTRDGKGIEILKKHNIKSAIITSEDTEIVRRRAKKLKIDFLFQGIEDKSKIIKKLSEKTGFSFEEIAFIGDDINDLSALKIVGIPISVLDGSLENKKIAKLVVPLNGGRGCVRYVCDLIDKLKNNNYEI